TLLDARRLEKQPFVRGHCVARPVAEPGIAGDNRRTGDDELICGKQQLCIDGVRSRDCEGLGAGSSGSDRALRRRIAEITGPAADDQLIARRQLSLEGARVPEILMIVEPTSRLLPVADARIPLAGRAVARAGDTVRALEDISI